LGTVAHPLFSSLQHDTELVKKGFLTAAFLSATLAMPVFVGVAVVADTAVPLIFGGKWAEAIWPIRIYCGLGITSCIGILQSSLITSQGRADWWFYYQLTTGIATLVIMILSARLGVTTMLAFILLKTIVFWPVTVVKAAGLISLRLVDYIRQFAAPAGATLIMALAIGLERTAVSMESPHLSFILDVVTGALAYAAGIAALGRAQIWTAIAILRGVLSK